MAREWVCKDPSSLASSLGNKLEAEGGGRCSPGRGGACWVRWRTRWEPLETQTPQQAQGRRTEANPGGLLGAGSGEGAGVGRAEGVCIGEELQA